MAQRILIQIDSDPHASVFDAVTAIDADVEHLLQYANIEPTNVRGLVHGAMFTRGPAELKNTAIFIGGSNASLGDAIGQEIVQSFFGPVRVSVMIDGNGANTTAVAAVLSSARHLPLAQTTALVLGGTGPVGMRVARLILRQGGNVLLASRDQSRAEQACKALAQKLAVDRERLVAVGTSEGLASSGCLAKINAVFGCGAAGVPVLSSEQLESAKLLRVAIDLNAVPPAGIEGIGVTDKAVQRGTRYDYGAVGVGGLKMKIHRQAIRQLFTRNDLVLDAEEIFAIGQQIEAQRS